MKRFTTFLSITVTSAVGLAMPSAAFAVELAPTVEISGGATNLSGYLWGTTADVDGNIYVADAGAGNVKVFDGSPGDVAPIATITNTAENLNNVYDVEVDADGLIYVTNTNGIVVFPAGSDGPTVPVREITGFEGYGIALGHDGTIYVTLNEDDGDVVAGSVYVFTADAEGEATPSKVLPGDGDSVDVAVDERGNVYLSNYADSRIDIWESDAASGSQESRSIVGDATLIDNPYGIDVTCSTGTIVISNSGTNEVFAFDATAEGDVAPEVLVTGIDSYGLGVGLAGGLYVTGNGDDGVGETRVSAFPFDEPCAAADSNLADTGVEPAQAGLVAAALIAAGGIAVAVRRRKA